MDRGADISGDSSGISIARCALMRTFHSPILGALLTLPISLACCSGSDTSPPDPYALPAPDAAEGFQIREEAFSLSPGTEGLYCEKIPLPASYGDGPVFLRGVETRLSLRTHHFFMAYDEEDVRDRMPCVGDTALQPLGEAGGHSAEDGKMIFLSGAGDYATFLPDGYALALASGRGHFSTSHHVLNVSTEPGDVGGTFNLYTAPEAEVRHPVNILNCLATDIDVPPQSEGTVGGTCTAPFDLDMVVLGSHAHHFLQRFEMWIADEEGERTGDPIYTSTNWDSPAIVTLDQPISIHEGQGLAFQCTYRNATDEPVIYGTGDHGEMCAVMSAYAYPTARVHEIPPTLGTVINDDGGSVPLFDTTNIDLPF